MDKYLISIDLDDTFLDKDKNISKEAIDYVQHLVNNGHHFIINTGRPHQGAIAFLKKLGIHEPMIVNNGGAIVEYDEEYSHIKNYHIFPIGNKKIEALLRRTKPYLETATVTSINTFHTINLEKTPFWVIHPSENIKFVEGDIENKLEDHPFISEFYVNEKYKDKFEKVLKQKRFQNLSITRWGCFDGIAPYEISSSKASKGNAMLYLAKKYHIKKENTISFGDQLNDLSMIKMANYGVSMCSARDEVKSQAKYITDFDFNNDGVIKFLQKIIKE